MAFVFAGIVQYSMFYIFKEVNNSLFLYDEKKLM